MANKPLDNLVSIRKLKVEEATTSEISGLLRSGIARIEDAEHSDLNKESRFDLAYNAAHALSLAAMRKAGYPARKTATSCSTVLSTRWVLPPNIGECLIRPIENETWRSMKAKSMSTTSFWKR